MLSAEYYVANGGDDWANGDINQPFQTIRRALDAAHAATLLKHLRTLWDAPVGYKREAHYMRGPGPKCREKQAGQRETKRS